MIMHEKTVLLLPRYLEQVAEVIWFSLLNLRRDIDLFLHLKTKKEESFLLNLLTMELMYGGSS